MNELTTITTQWAQEVQNTDNGKYWEIPQQSADPGALKNKDLRLILSK